MKLIRLIRLRQIIRHQTPTRREITDEYTFLNDSGEKQRFLIVEAYDYRANLHVYDSDGEELAIYTNNIVRDYLKQQRDALATEILGNIENRRKYVQWIPLPEGKEIQPDEARTIRFVYMDKKREYVMRTKRLFYVPEFTIGKDVEPNMSYTSHFVVIPPEGFEIGVGEREIVEHVPKGDVTIEEDKLDHYHRTITDELLEFAIPSRENKLTFSAPYTILPEKSEANLYNYFFSGLYFVAAAFLAAALFLKGQVTPSIVAAFAAGEASIVAVCVGFLGLVTNPLTHRMKFYMCIPMALAATTLLLIVIGI